MLEDILEKHGCSVYNPNTDNEDLGTAVEISVINKNEQDTRMGLTLAGSK